MSTATYLTSNDEVDSSSILTNDLVAAMETQARYIDVFLNGKHTGTLKWVNDRYVDINSDEYRKAH